MKNKSELTPEQALIRLQNLCNRGEYCTSEITNKLIGWAVSPQSIQKIIHRLRSDKLLDDERFAVSFAHSKAIYSHWGKLKIRLALLRKKIEKDYIENALDKIDPEEYEVALTNVIEIKRRQLKEEADTYEGRTKIFRYAASKGYETSLIVKIMKS